jgi:hypothetical protein
METKFQTSFIPKKPIVSESAGRVRSSVNLFTVISVTIFLISITAAGGSIAWQRLLTTQLEDYRKQLEARRQQFEPALIETLKRVNTKIDNTKKLLDGHIAASDIFDLIGNLTIENVRFRSFDFSAPASGGDDVKVTMRGDGASFKAIAYQSDVFGKNKIIKNPLLTDISLDSTGSGHVSFTFSGSISPKILLYKESLKRGGAIPSEQIIDKVIPIPTGDSSSQ